MKKNENIAAILDYTLIAVLIYSCLWVHQEFGILLAITAMVSLIEISLTSYIVGIIPVFNFTTHSFWNIVISFFLIIGSFIFSEVLITSAAIVMLSLAKLLFYSLILIKD